MTRVNVAVVGASGYAGQECLRLLAAHPNVSRVAMAPSRDGPDAIPRDVDAVFLATPPETSAELAWPLALRGQRVIDLSGAHRAGGAAAHKAAYGFDHPFADALAEAVYGFDASCASLAHARLIANPGCYSNALLSAIVPLVQAGWCAPGAVVDATGISAVSGAGRTPTERTMFMHVADNLAPYKAGRAHQHIVEIERRVPVRMLFMPIVAPLRRGMLVTGSVELRDAEPRPLDALAMPGDAMWRRVDTVPDVIEVAGTPEVHVHYIVDAIARRVLFTSSIDNLLRGAASHAIVNFNRAFTLPDEAGLRPVSA